MPFVLVALLLAGTHVSIGTDVLAPLPIGVAVGLVVGRLLAWAFFRIPSSRFRLAEYSDGLVLLALAFLPFAVAELLHGNGFLAVFTAAVCVRTSERSHGYHEVLHTFGRQLERLFVAITLLGLGFALGDGLLRGVTVREILFAAVAVFVVRPLTGIGSLLRSPARGRAALAIAFFGVRGIGTLYYLAYGLHQADLPGADQLWRAGALAVALSVLIHGILAAPVMRRVEEQGARAAAAPGRDGQLAPGKCSRFPGARAGKRPPGLSTDASAHPPRAASMFPRLPLSANEITRPRGGAIQCGHRKVTALAEDSLAAQGFPLLAPPQTGNHARRAEIPAPQRAGPLAPPSAPRADAAAPRTAALAAGSPRVLPPVPTRQSWRSFLPSRPSGPHSDNRSSARTTARPPGRVMPCYDDSRESSASLRRISAPSPNVSRSSGEMRHQTTPATTRLGGRTTSSPGETTSTPGASSQFPQRPGVTKKNAPCGDNAIGPSGRPPSNAASDRQPRCVGARKTSKCSPTGARIACRCTDHHPATTRRSTVAEDRGTVASRPPSSSKLTGCQVVSPSHTGPGSTGHPSAA